MSSTDGTNNIQAHSTDPANNPHPYPHDPKYYYPDGSAVFLVEGVLFKLQASLIVGPRSRSPGSSLTTGQYLTDVKNPYTSITESSDNDPVRLEDVTANQFRTFLSAVLGLPSDPKYSELFADASDSRKHNQELLVRYLDIACLASQFGISELEVWAGRQLELILKSMYSLSQGEWDTDTLFRLLSHSGSTYPICDLARPSAIFVQHFISISAEHTEEQPSNLDTCIRLYLDLSLLTCDLVVFGCAFAFMMSLDPRSTLQSLILTRMEKAVLRAAQVELLPISETLESVHWLTSPVEELPFYDKLCSGCQLQLRTLWAKTFGKCNGLKSRSLGKDIGFLCRLPQYRRYFADQWDTNQCFKVENRYIQPNEPKDRRLKATFLRMPGSYNTQPQSERHERPEELTEVECIQQPINRIDYLIHSVYRELAEQYKRFAAALPKMLCVKRHRERGEQRSVVRRGETSFPRCGVFRAGEAGERHSRDTPHPSHPPSGPPLPALFLYPLPTKFVSVIASCSGPAPPARSAGGPGRTPPGRALRAAPAAPRPPMAVRTLLRLTPVHTACSIYIYTYTPETRGQVRRLIEFRIFIVCLTSTDFDHM
ncbi:hypothetical protein CTheo_8716 [Ceratobasidium theobromae]|uniref:BTB domain-containing protein n=1 Tax=Ceratobasidium theobromae TaxID=1582974 RepID=A0A5N5Q7W4_9AGAM|nr:hypothetical protein CTheo_8716 [Ceratobasidium theobromae]